MSGLFSFSEFGIEGFHDSSNLILTALVEDWFEISSSLLPLSIQGQYLAVGTHMGLVQIWDAAAEKKTSTINGHSARVGEEILFSLST